MESCFLNLKWSGAIASLLSKKYLNHGQGERDARASKEKIHILEFSWTSLIL